MTSPAATIVPFEYQGQPVKFNTAGWINATEAARRFGKRPADWLKQKETREYLAALADALKSDSESLYTTRKGKGVAGTWLHPKLATAFARWLSVDFAVWCDMQIERLIHGDQDDWQQLRDSAAIGYQGMCDALNLTREAQGKQSAPHHYMNEARLLNGVLFGEFKSRQRDTMPPSELRLLTMLEQRNIFLMGQGLAYQERKQALTDYVEKHLRPRLSGGR